MDRLIRFCHTAKEQPYILYCSWTKKNECCGKTTVASVNVRNQVCVLQHQSVTHPLISQQHFFPFLYLRRIIDTWLLKAPTFYKAIQFVEVCVCVCGCLHACLPVSSTVSKIKYYDQSQAAVWCPCLVGYTTKPGVFHVNTASLFLYSPMPSLMPTAGLLIHFLFWG